MTGDESRLALAIRKIAELESEVDRLRRELEEAFGMARGIGEERNELATQLGEEVARSQEFKRLLKTARGWVYSGSDAAAEIDAALGPVE